MSIDMFQVMYMKNKKAMVFVLILLVLTITVSGCTQQSGGGTQIKNKEEAAQKISNISTSVDKVTSALEKITESLGGG